MVLTAMSAGGNTRPTWIRAWAQKRPLKLGSFSQQIWRVSGCAKLNQAMRHVWGRIMADPFYSTSRWHSSPPRKSWSVMVPTSWRSLRSPLCCCSSLCSALDVMGRPWTLCAQPVSAPTVGATADIPIWYSDPYSDHFLSQSRKMSESQTIRPSSSNLSSDASWRLPSLAHMTTVVPRLTSFIIICWWSLQWPLCWWMQLTKGWRSALLHHRRGKSGDRNMYSKRTCQMEDLRLGHAWVIVHFVHYIPVVLHKAVAEVSKIGNL